MTNEQIDEQLAICERLSHNFSVEAQRQFIIASVSGYAEALRDLKYSRQRQVELELGIAQLETELRLSDAKMAELERSL